MKKSQISRHKAKIFMKKAGISKAEFSKLLQVSEDIMQKRQNLKMKE